jgi:hypothetical protein
LNINHMEPNWNHKIRNDKMWGKFSGSSEFCMEGATLFGLHPSSVSPDGGFRMCQEIEQRATFFSGGEAYG